MKLLSKLGPVWLVAQREFQDEFRDWRVTFPMSSLILVFPFMMDAFSEMAVDFLQRYNTELLLQRLVPFVILIIGFFPLTVSLVIALESFVGEKERGTIEPLLSAPLEDWQLYAGKLLVSAVTPLITSYLAIGIYLWMVSRKENMELPPLDATIQLLVVTAAHSFLMVSAAIVVSVQSTSVKAANLLASFIIIPVAILMQGETVVIVWGDRTTLWLAALGVTILAALLIRLGVAHFHREYLLGREIDSFNLKWMWRLFKERFVGGARSISEWYRRLFRETVKPLLPSLLIVALIGAASLWFSYDWMMKTAPEAFARAAPDRLERIQDRLSGMVNLKGQLNAPYLFLNNSRVMLVIFALGAFSFGVLGILAYAFNIGLIGAVSAMLTLFGFNPLTLFAAGILPHGIFELPALALAAASVLRFGARLVTPRASDSMGQAFIEQTADWMRLFAGVILPLLLVAALIEAHITPLVLRAVMK